MGCHVLVESVVGGREVQGHGRAQQRNNRWLSGTFRIRKFRYLVATALTLALTSHAVQLHQLSYLSRTTSTQCIYPLTVVALAIDSAHNPRAEPLAHPWTHNRKLIISQRAAIGATHHHGLHNRLRMCQRQREYNGGYCTNICQLGGVTLTSAVLYLSISLHTQNRMQQAALLRQQRQVLADFYEPKQPEPEPTYRVVPVGLAETVKDGWNRRLEGAVKTIYDTDWRRVREETEDRASAILEKIRQQSK